MPDNIQEIFKATFDTEKKQVMVNVSATHLPVLCYAMKLLEIEIEKRLVSMMIKQEIKDRPAIVIPGLEIGGGNGGRG